MQLVKALHGAPLSTVHAPPAAMGAMQVPVVPLRTQESFESHRTPTSPQGAPAAATVYALHFFVPVVSQ